MQLPLERGLVNLETAAFFTIRPKVSFVNFMDGTQVVIREAEGIARLKELSEKLAEYGLLLSVGEHYVRYTAITHVELREKKALLSFLGREIALELINEADIRTVTEWLQGVKDIPVKQVQTPEAPAEEPRKRKRGSK